MSATQSYTEDIYIDLFRFSVRLGEHDIATVEDWRKYATEPLTVQDIHIDSAVKHPKYDHRRKLNDIGLIRLRSPANLEKPNIQTICLPIEEGNQFENLEDDQKKHLIIAGMHWLKFERSVIFHIFLKAGE